MYDRELLRKFARYEITARDLPKEYFQVDEEGVEQLETVYQITLDDMLAVVSRLEQEDIKYLQYMDDWYAPIEYGYVLGKLLGVDELNDESHTYDFVGMRRRDPAAVLPKNDLELCREIMDSLGYAVREIWYDADNDFDDVYANGKEIVHDEEEGVIYEEEDDVEPVYPLARDVLDLKYIRELVRCVEENKTKPVSEWDFPDSIKKSYVWQQDEAIHDGDEPEADYKALFKRYLEEMADKGDREALEILGYQYYGGTSVYPCDWVKAKEIFTDLFEKTGEAHFANTLGYIYYYGRTTKGIPDNEKAFYYFSYGAAAGIYESRYKISDMIAKGRAVPQNKELAASIISQMYKENRAGFESEFFDCKFADLALRMGGICENSTDDYYEPDLDEALGYYLQARLAIQRRKEFNFYGDSKVERSIEEAIARVTAKDVELDSDNTDSKVEVDVGPLLDDYNDECCYVRLNQENGKTSMTFTRDNGSDYLITLPKYMYCGLITEVTLEHDGKTAFVKKPDINREYVKTNMSYNFDNESWEFYCGEEMIFEIKDKGWMFDMEQGNSDDAEKD